MVSVNGIDSYRNDTDFRKTFKVWEGGGGGKVVFFLEEHLRVTPVIKNKISHLK